MLDLVALDLLLFPLDFKLIFVLIGRISIMVLQIERMAYSLRYLLVWIDMIMRLGKLLNGSY